MSTSNKNHPSKSRAVIVLFALLLIVATIALVSWMIYGNTYQLGATLGFFIGGLIWSFFVGLYVGRQRVQILWLIGVCLLLGAIVVGLNFFGILDYVIGSFFAAICFCAMLIGLLLRRHRASGGTNEHEIE